MGFFLLYYVFICNYINKLRVENCQVGGAVGAVKGGDGADKYEPSVLHKLTNIEGDTYYYARWAHGYTKPIYTALSFYTE